MVLLKRNTPPKVGGKNCASTGASLMLQKAAEIRPSVIVKLWRHSSVALLRHVMLCNINE